MSRKELASDEPAGRKISATVLHPRTRNDVLRTPASYHGSDHESSISQQAVIRTYRRYAPIYDWIFGAVLQPGRQALTAAVRDLDPGSVLEVGVGTGLSRLLL